MKLELDYESGKIKIHTTLESVAGDRLPEFIDNKDIVVEGDLTDESVLEAHTFMMEQRGKESPEIPEPADYIAA